MPQMALNLHNPNLTMKYLILILLLVSPAAHANWFSWSSDPIPEYKEKVASLETQLSAQRSTTDHWQIASGSLGIGCVLLLVIGTALGAKTRHHYHAERRLGSTPPPSINGQKSRIVGKKAEENVHSTLAA